jgi:uncharacterized membrane protein YfcA
VSIPHLIATTLRFWMLRGHIDKKVFMSFGLMSAVGGLIGALLHTWFESAFLTMIFGGLLLFSGFMGVTGLSSKMRFGKKSAMIAGVFSGMFGGLVGNQGGIRSGALLAFDLSPQAFVATATAIGIIVDAARMPVYLAADFKEIAEIWFLVVIAVVGTVGGTVLGMRVLQHVPRDVFQRVVSALVLVLGAYMIYSGLTR